MTLWCEVLGRAEDNGPLLDLLERHLEHPLVELARLRKASAATCVRPHVRTRAAFNRWCRRAARQLRAHDLDRALVERTLRWLQVREPTRHKKQRRHLQGVQEINKQAIEARNNMVRANLRLVVAIAHRYNFGRLSFHDLIQEGNIGLIKAVGRFDHRRGNRLRGCGRIPGMSASQGCR